MKNKKIFDKLENKVPKPKGGKVEHAYATGGVEIEMTKPNESQKEMVKGQGKILTEKKRSATWY